MGSSPRVPNASLRNTGTHTYILRQRPLLIPQGSIFSQRHRGHLGCLALCVGCLGTAECGNTPGLHPLHSRSTAPTPLMTIKIPADVPHVYLCCRRVHTGQSARGRRGTSTPFKGLGPSVSCSSLLQPQKCLQLHQTSPYGRTPTSFSGPFHLAC